MRLFQNSAVYPAYRARLTRLTASAKTFEECRAAFLADRFGASHFLQPVLTGDASAFFTNGDDTALQGLWAREHSLPAKTDLAKILLAQIEEHRAEVFYNLDPMRYSGKFVKCLPGCVKRSIAWRAAPSPGADFAAYDLVVCNFPSILDSYRQQGWGAAYFAPGHDPVMDRYSQRQDRPIDLLFVGGYTRHHARRAALLEAMAALPNKYRVAMHLDCSRLTMIAESPVGRLLPLAKHRRPNIIRRVAKPAIFGLDLYDLLSSAKVILNGAIDMAVGDRGNMRCFETLGTGGLLLSDAGEYPRGMQDTHTMITYANVDDALNKLKNLLANDSERRTIAAAGHHMVRSTYSKSVQWQAFLDLAA